MGHVADRKVGAAAIALALAGWAGACSVTPTFVDTTGTGGHTGTTAASSGHGAHTASATSSAGAGASAVSATSTTSATTTTTTSATSASSTGDTSASSTGSTTASSTSATSASSTSGCMPHTCGAGQCGSVPDGCGGTLQCGGCSASEVCYDNACCQPQTCQQLGKDCNFPSDGCGATVSCGACPPGDGCGSGGTPNVCAQVAMSQCGTTCPPGTTLVATLTDASCGGTCSTSPGASVVCLYQGLPVTPQYGCDLATACPTGWQLAGAFLNCTCPNFGNYWVCVPP